MTGLTCSFYNLLSCFCNSSLYYDSTAKKNDIKVHTLGLLNRHRMVFGNYRWTEFDEDFLSRNIESVAIVDAEREVCKHKTSSSTLTF